MDHVLNAIQPHYEAILNCFLEEQRIGKYKKFSENPYYEEIKALIDAMNILRTYLGWNVMTLKKEIEFYL